MAAPFATSSIFSDTPILHGFFGREGGHSEGVFASNNMSIAAGDDPQAVERNRAGAAQALGRQRRDLVLLKQTHSTIVHLITDRNSEDVAMEGDAMVTKHAGVVLGILTADCSPVLFADPEAGVVAAAHAGWKGAAGGIVKKTIAAMVALGANPRRIRAAIGPTISGANYEVGPQTAADIAALDHRADRHISIPATGTREHFDIPGLLMEQLFDLGVGLVADLQICTYADPERYFSHRYATHQGSTTGRQIALIALK